MDTGSLTEWQWTMKPPFSSRREISCSSIIRPYGPPRMGRRTLLLSAFLGECQSMSKNPANGDPCPLSRTSVHHRFSTLAAM